MILVGDSFAELAKLPSESVQCCVTSPPYWGLRDYGHAGQLGLEPTPDAYVGNMRLIFEQVRRVLKADGTLWLNLGDSYAQGGSGGASAKSRLHGGKGVGPNEKVSLMQGKSFARKAPKGLKPKDLVGIPWRVAFALQSDGWYLRQDIIWHKPNPMPESVRDRCTKAHEYLFLLSKNGGRPLIWQARDTREWSHNPNKSEMLGELPRWVGFDYLFNTIKEPAKYPAGSGNRASNKHIAAYENDERLHTKAGLHEIGPRDSRQKRSVWTVTTKPYKGAHFATFPPDLIEPCVLAGSRPGDTVLDPFFGAGTTGLVAQKHGREYIGIEINPDYAELARVRIEGAKGISA